MTIDIVVGPTVPVADTGGGGVGVITPPLVAEHFGYSNSNFSPTGAITPPPPCGHHTPPPPSENPVSARLCAMSVCAGLHVIFVLYVLGLARYWFLGLC